MKILLCVLSNDNFIHYFPLGIAYLASVLRDNKHSVTIYNQDVHHYSEEHLTKYLDNHKFDLVAVGAISGYYPYRRLLKVAEAINKSINRPFFLLGGHMPSASPEYFLEKTKADCVIVGEAELTILRLLSDLENKKPTDKILLGELVSNLDAIPFPAYNMFMIEYYRLQRFPNINNNEFSMSVITGRGCNFKCTFCFRLTPGIRLRSIDSIVAEIKFLKAKYNISYIDFADDLTFASKQRTTELCEAFIKHDLNIKWRCEGRLNYTDLDILRLAKRAGCVFINYGIEALDDKVLANMKKALTVSQIINGVEATIKAEISPGLNVIFGNIGDNKETIKKAVEFLVKYDDGSQVRTIRPVTPYPGCELFKTAQERRLIIDAADFYENKHVNSDLITCNFTELSDQEFYSCLYRANFELLHNYYKNKIYSTEKQLKQLYIEKNINFRGWRHQ